MKRSLTKCLVCYLVVALVVIGMVQRAFAGFSPSEAISVAKFDRSSDLKKIQKVLEMKVVGERLKELGFTPGEIQGRLAQLSDEQLHRLALHLDELQVGGDAGWVIVFLLIAILVVLILYLSGHRLVVKKG
ncbi:MAG: PA2779 family protein [Syntrophaceae bacterium]|nr:PA2779 family protein [Syntrophaceae bacterium]